MSQAGRGYNPDVPSSGVTEQLAEYLRRTTPFALAALLALASTGCRSTLEACYVGCVMWPRSWNDPKPHIDRSTTHCDALAGNVYEAENGDELRFAARSVELHHAGTTETRAWECRPNRLLHIAGPYRFEHEGLAKVESGGLVRWGARLYRPRGSPHVFPCETLPGARFLAPDGDTLAFETRDTVHWTTPAGATTLRVRCADRKITFPDRPDDEPATFITPADLPSSMADRPAFIDWNGRRFERTPDDGTGAGR